MKKLLFLAALAWVGAATFGTWSAPLRSVVPALQAQAGAAAQAGDAAQYRAMLDQYCVGCHNSRTGFPVTDPVNLEEANLDDVLASGATWERVLRKLSVQAMPPQGMPRPEPTQYAAFTTWLSGSLDRAAALRNDPGRYVVHRLNRAEYANTIRDLLAIEVNVEDLLPSDGADFGFDNIATALTTSPFLLERYVTAAQRIAALAMGNSEVLPGTTEYIITLETSQNQHVEGLPLGTRGGTAINHVFPADAEYVLSARLNKTILNGYAGVEGNDIPNEFLILVDGEQVYSAMVGGPDDHAEAGEEANIFMPQMEERLRGRVFVTAGTHEVIFTWRDKRSARQDIWEPSLRDSQEVHMVTGQPRLRNLFVEGPYNVTGISDTPSRDRILVCSPAAAADEAACAEEIVENLTRRAFRRPVTADDFEAPLAFYTETRDNGGDFEAGIRAAVARTLVSPWFLYRVERDAADIRPGAAHPVSDVELASRLSFFLWSSIPDEELLSLAEAGRLREPGVLEAQVTRMIADRRSDALMSNFTGQWLQLRNLEAKVVPDLLMFPDFDNNIRQGFRRETEMFFSYIVRENRSALELLSANYTFLNERLAKHYGVEGVYGSRFRRVELTDPNRFGLLGHGSILSLTAVATRTSPVFRGKYVLAQFLNTPAPPPPPAVPTLEESAGTREAPRTVREQLERHRANPVCASCHGIIDPVGFALENFNPVGQWRETTAQGPVDAAGVLADGSPVNGPVDLRNVILSRPDALATILSERMLTYALGRGVEPADMSVVRSIVRDAAANDYRFMPIIMGIVESAPFQMRTKLEPADTVNAVAQANTRVN